MKRCEHCSKNKHRSDDEKKYLKTRLKTIEGQVRGISNMIEEDRYCNDILTQLLAINKSIKSLSNDILKNHLATCVVDDIQNNHLDVIDEVMDLIGRIN
ncbi:MAG: metal-sensing transcriptional repressor [Erysipelotrichaceae bacterium]|nr:metal-sensing transcriptional repressor [Erysipelotrichaceae bacterium]